MWNYITALFRQMFNVNIILNEKNVLFGITGTDVPWLKKQHLKRKSSYREEEDSKEHKESLNSSLDPDRVCLEAI